MCFDDAVGIDFNASSRPTLGVEWEFALVDATTRDLSNTASDLFDAVRDSVGELPQLHQELLRNTVEVVTGVCDTVEEAMADLAGTLSLVRPVARGSASTSTPPAPTRSRSGPPSCSPPDRATRSSSSAPSGGAGRC